MGGRQAPQRHNAPAFRHFLLSTPSPMMAVALAMALAMQSALAKRSDFAPKPTPPRHRFKSRAREGRPGRLLRKAFTGKVVTPDADVPLIHLSAHARRRRLLAEALAA